MNFFLIITSFFLFSCAFASPKETDKELSKPESSESKSEDHQYDQLPRPYKKLYYFGVELGTTNLQGSGKSDNDYQGTAVNYHNKNFSFSKSNIINMHYGIYCLELDIPHNPNFILEFNLSHTPNEDYKAKPYIEVKRDISFLGSIAKISYDWFALGIGFGMAYINRSVKKNNDPQITTNLKIDTSTYTNFYSLVTLELKKKYNEKFQYYLALSAYNWTKDHKIATSLDKRNSPPSYLEIYKLPDRHSITSISVGVNYFFDQKEK